MSEADLQATSILLPSSGVTVYSKDKETLEAARQIENDWRFARVKIQVEEGDIRTAIAAYKEFASPDLVIVQTDTIDDSLTGHLEELAGNCSADTAAIVIGPVNDVYLYRKLIEMGVSDYLVRPTSAPVLAGVIAKTLIERLGVTGSRLIAFIGSKGGVGASALAQAAAWGVSDILGQKTMLFDASGGWSSLSVGMGFEPSTTLAEAARAASNDDEESLKRMLFKASDKLSVLASGGDVMMEQPLEPEHLEKLIDMLMVKYPVLIADLSNSAPNLVRTVMARAHQIVVVSTPNLGSLRLARSLIHEIKDLRGGKDDGIDMVINMQGMAPANEVSKSDIEAAMEFKISTIIPFAAKSFMGMESQSKKLSADKDGDLIVTTHVLPVVQKSLSVQAPVAVEAAGDEGFIGGLLKKLKK